MICRQNENKLGVNGVKQIPDFDTELDQSISFVFESEITKKALVRPPFDNFANILLEIIHSIDRLADNCHMAEFTNHAMPHICSIIKRASEWAESDGWIKRISSQEAAYLLLALLIHDIGMLSQDAKYIPAKERSKYIKGSSDIANWVRRTHVIRIDGLVKYILNEYIKKDVELEIHLNVIIGMASSHDKWPWQQGFVSCQHEIQKLKLTENRIAALNAIIAVCDLLDEDSNRCDTIVLIKHHHGTVENMAHWIRHALTKEVIGVEKQEVTVVFRTFRLEIPDNEMIYRALRNHYRLVKLYNGKLVELGAQIIHINFQPNDGLPIYKDMISDELEIYKQIPELRNDLVPQLMSTFMKEALNKDDGDQQLRQRLDAIGLECIDLSSILYFMEPCALLHPEERVIFGKDEISLKLNYMKNMAEDAYVNGRIGKLRHICALALNEVKKEVKEVVLLEHIYWIFAYMLVYQKGDLDYSSARIDYPNSFDFDYNDRVSNKIQRDCTYSKLLDVLFCFLMLRISEEYILDYEKFLCETDYSLLKEDMATELLCCTIIGLFWFWDGEGDSWRRVSHYMREHIRIDALSKKMLDLERQLSFQYDILYRNHCVTDEILNQADIPSLAKAWTYFYRADWKMVAQIIPELIRDGELNKDQFSAIQGFQNMTRPVIQWNDIEIKGIDTKFEYAGIYRYQRAAEEPAFPAYWQAREAKIESLLAEIRSKPGKAANKRMESLRLISLRCVEGVRMWNLGEYLESVRNYTLWLYSNSMYRDKYGKYCGYPTDLPKAIITCIQGMDNECFEEDERKKLIETMKVQYPQGFSEVIQFIINNECKCTWRYAIEWIESMIKELHEEELSIVLRWLPVYDNYIQTCNEYINLGEFDFISDVAERLTDEDWQIVMPIIQRVYNNPHMYRSNEKLGKRALCYMPLEDCKKMLKTISQWDEEGEMNVKSEIVYELCISLHLERKDEIKDALHRFIDACKDIAPCEIYDELKELIEIKSLSERKEPDMGSIQVCLDETLRKLDDEKILSGYDSRVMKEIRHKCTNQNWRLAEENDVLVLISQIQDFLQKHREDISAHYFYDFCGLFCSISRMGTPAEKSKITTFFIEHYIKAPLEQVDEKEGFADGPLNAFHLDLGGSRRLNRGIGEILLNGITQIPKTEYAVCMYWIHKRLVEDRGFLYFAAVMLCSYVYFEEGAELKMFALANLMYIRGYLEEEGRFLNTRRESVCKAIENLKEVTEWFENTTFDALAEKDEQYKKLFLNVVKGWK